jgi:hypothetical protein
MARGARKSQIVSGIVLGRYPVDNTAHETNLKTENDDVME